MNKIYILIIGFLFSACAKQVPDKAKHVNSFWGVEQTHISDKVQIAENLPRIDTMWYEKKPTIGGTNPGATLPFGMVSCVSSYGEQVVRNYPAGYNGKEFIGLSHFQQSGTGTIRWYYNYLLFTPTVGDLSYQKKPEKIISEDAAPGWYSCMLESGINAETVVAEKSAMHRFSFPDDGEKHLVIDVCHFLEDKDTTQIVPEQFPESVSVETITANSASGKIVMDGFPIWFYIELDTPADQHAVFIENKSDGLKEYASANHTKNTGVFFSFESNKTNTIHSKIGFSFNNAEQAKANLHQDFADWNFENYKLQADQLWDKQLSKIRVEDDNENAVDLFYTAMAKAITKPSLCKGENPFNGRTDFMYDFSTFWDVYATQIPFIFTFYPEIGEKIMRFYKEQYHKFSCYPPALFMKKGMSWLFSKQASALGAQLFSDAYYKKLDVGDWNEILEIMIAEMNNERGEMYQQGIPLAPCRTHNIDYSYSAFCTSQLAKELGKNDTAESYFKMSSLWKPMYDEDGVLIFDRNLVETKKYPMQKWTYYEGNEWNYSYKIWHDMQGHIDMQGGEEKFCENLDWYFNINKDIGIGV